jgi:pyruvate dehydrogenase (quinone)
MMLCEFLTAVQHKLPVKAVVYNNSTLGLIRLEAESMGPPAWKAMCCNRFEMSQAPAI